MKSVLATILLSLLINYSAMASSPSETVQKFVYAFNQHNVDGMLALSSFDLKWMSVAGEKVSVQASTHETLREAMQGYFKSTPSARSEIKSIRESGTFVFTLEKAFWLSAGAEKSQCSMAVYELRENKIENVWYFAEHKC